jgi:sugar lactone lactonase YvrE
MNPTVEHLIPSQNKLGEGPLWSAAEQALYWVDIHQKRVERFEPARGKRNTWTFDQAVTVLGLRRAGGFVFAGERGFGFWDGADGGLALAGHPEAHLPYNRFNDGAVDPAGRFWAGSMYEGPQTGQPADGRLYRFDPGGKST